MLKGMFSKVESVCCCLLCAGWGGGLGGSRDGRPDRCSDPRKRQMARAQTEAVRVEKTGDAQIQ